MRGRGVGLVVFDCDGVLVDSEVIACRVEAEVLTAIGFPHTFEDVRRDYVGLGAASVRRLIEQRFGRAVPEEFRARSLAAALAAFEEELRPIPGVAEAVGRIALPRCIASSSDPARIRRSLELTGLLDVFAPHLFSATMVEHGKPAPDLFLHAANTMGVPSSCCIVIEDSVPGVLAARAAGMTVFGFHGGSHCGADQAAKLEAAGADALFAEMRSLPDLVAQLE